MTTFEEPEPEFVVHNPEQHPRRSPFHDVLLVRQEFIPGQRASRFERFAIDKTTGTYKNDPGANKLPVRADAEGYRPTMNLASLGQGTPDDPARGPALSMLPLHPSPAASSATTCYLVNPQNLNYETAWTAEEWNDLPGGYDAEGRVGKNAFSMLIATPAGKVYYLEKKLGTNGEELPVEAEVAGLVFHEVQLGLESEIWMQLRNGCVVGRAVYENRAGRSRREKVVPLVNIDSLSPREEVKE